MFFHIQKGDVVVRLLADVAEMHLTVTEVDDRLIHCGPWTFDRLTGAEVDHDLGWGPMYGGTGSYIQEIVI